MESSFLNPQRVVAASGIHEGMKVADFGAGSGFFTRAAARAVDLGGVVWAVDLMPNLLTRIKNLSLAEGLKNVEIIRGDIEHMGGSHLPEGAFDFVIMANVLFALECTDCAVNEVARVLKRHGKVLVIDWRDSFGGLGPHPDHVVQQAAARDMFERKGFSFVGDVDAGAYHWACVFKK